MEWYFCHIKFSGQFQYSLGVINKFHQFSGSGACIVACYPSQFLHKWPTWRVQQCQDILHSPISLLTALLCRGIFLVGYALSDTNVPVLVFYFSGFTCLPSSFSRNVTSMWFGQLKHFLPSIQHLWIWFIIGLSLQWNSDFASFFYFSSYLSVLAEEWTQAGSNGDQPQTV